MPKARAETMISNKYGFHARPSTSFSALARTFRSAVRIEADGQPADGKSVIALMSLGAPQGTAIVIETEGEDAEQAAAALKAHVEARFGGIE